MRKESLYFYRYGKYRCANEAFAEENVYSKPDVMSYYMNALLVSQILWKHHFMMFDYFKKKIKIQFVGHANTTILDVGPGHGFFSFIIKKEFPDYQKIDIVDISETSLKKTRKVLGEDIGKINYYRSNIFDYQPLKNYDLIVLGEVLEHLDDPRKILFKLAEMLSSNGLIWITTPTNSPALDHVYLFKTIDEIKTLVKSSGLNVVDSCHYYSEDVSEKTALKNKITNLVGLFCKKS
ncbi:class I SAM-dependent methyltransferase [Algoriphagus sp. 4150]|uniref:class I SAM-dependent methyltransferase n=1 Tax=Algoriphagus sp. 4150 TaxID=2817756 RepID=UPI00286B9AA9|nr:class I SAM-dependent methyltransferase [Algoriphagus sp. 4150]